MEYFGKELFVEIIGGFGQKLDLKYDIKLYCPKLQSFIMGELVDGVKILNNGFLSIVIDSMSTLQHFLKVQLHPIFRFLEVLDKMGKDVSKLSKLSIKSLDSLILSFGHYQLEISSQLNDFKFELLGNSEIFSQWTRALKTLKPLNFIQNTVRFYEFYDEMHQLAEFFTNQRDKAFVVELKMEHPLQVKLIFSDHRGLYFNFFKNRIILGDLISVAKEFTPIPFYLDSTRKPFPLGIISLLKSLPGVFISGSKSVFDLISIPISSSKLLLNELYTIVDSHICLTLAEQLYLKLGAVKVQSIPLTIMSDFGAKKLGFMVHLTDGLKAGGTGHNNPGTALSNVIFAKAHSLPIKKRFTFKWVEILVELQNMEHAILEDLVKLNVIDGCSFDLLSPIHLAHIAISSPCFLIDSKAKVLQIMVKCFN